MGEDIPGLTDSLIPRRLGPKRASKIRKLFALTKEDDVRKYVIRREIPAKSEDKKPSSKAPKKGRQLKAKTEAATYQKLCAQRQKESREKRQEKLSQRKSQRSSRAED